MEITSKMINDTLYVYLKGELDEHSANETRTFLDELFEKTVFKQVILDLYSLEFIDSTGVGVIIG
ncbi:MAG: anti-sigma factor antagonist, partial [Clostridia bacterium]|nr:anti-sigma factor antagonist [Clostridia bacterium]